MAEPPSTPFTLQTSFPPVIFSYCTKTDGGRGEQRMWQVASFLERHGIAFASRCEWRRGLDAEVGGQVGKMPDADVCA